MASTSKRRPLPALVALLALLLLTGLVWWRVIGRSGGSAGARPTCASSPAPAVRLPATRSVAVQVLNSTTRVGIAAKARAALQAAGFLVPAPARNDNKINTNKISVVAQIRFGPKGRAQATLVHYYFPGATLVQTTTTSSAVVVSLGKAYRQVATPAAVAKALKAAHAVSGTPAPAATAAC